MILPFCRNCKQPIQVKEAQIIFKRMPMYSPVIHLWLICLVRMSTMRTFMQTFNSLLTSNETKEIKITWTCFLLLLDMVGGERLFHF